LPEERPLIEVEGLWKRFRVWRRRPSTLREAFASLLRPGAREFEDMWALRDVNLAVARGMAFGLCGQNGSGKSTVLRTIAGIISPTHGRITVRGRIASMLDLGMGFHPELTGRENIALSAAVLGLSDREIRAKSDSIIEFAGIPGQIDHPVKTYSAGMYMRLGFAIAAHLDPEILLIDEVLAVGDMAFQSKCLAWLREQIGGGRTLLIVSHDVGLLADLCQQVAWLDDGGVREQGDPTTVLNLYAAHVLGAMPGGGDGR
jgi:lipopolysaccharide transport system ATP-binding protein